MNSKIGRYTLIDCCLKCLTTDINRINYDQAGSVDSIMNFVTFGPASTVHENHFVEKYTVVLF